MSCVPVAMIVVVMAFVIVVIMAFVGVVIMPTVVRWATATNVGGIERAKPKAYWPRA